MRAGVPLLLVAVGCAATGQKKPPPPTPVALGQPAQPGSSPADAQRAATDDQQESGTQERRAAEANQSSGTPDEAPPCEEAPWLSGVAAERGSSTEQLAAAVASAAERSWPEAELLATVFTGHVRGGSARTFSVTLPANRCFRALGAPEPPGPVRLDVSISRGGKVRWSNGDRTAESLAGIVQSPGELTPRCYCTGAEAERVRLSVQLGSSGRRPIVRPGKRSPEPRQPVAAGIFSFPRQPGS